MKDFDRIIWRDALTFVNFFATWSEPCQEMLAAVDQFQKKMNGRVDVYRIDVNDPDMADMKRRYNIQSVPTWLFFRRGEVLARGSGRLQYNQLVGVLQQLEASELAKQD